MFVALLVPTLCVGTLVLDALRHVGCHARYRHEETQSVEEGVPTPERGNENPSLRIGDPILDLFRSIGIGAIDISPGSVGIGAGVTRGLGRSLNQCRDSGREVRDRRLSSFDSRLPRGDFRAAGQRGGESCEKSTMPNINKL